MIDIFLLLLVGVIFRFSGGALRVGDRPFPIRAAGWALCMLATWLAASALGAWSPVWPVLALALAGVLLGSYLNQRILLIVADVVGLAIFGFLSIPPVGGVKLAGISVVTVGVWFAVDSFLLRSPRQVRTAILAASFGIPLITSLAFGVLRPNNAISQLRLLGDGFINYRSNIGSIGAVLGYSQLLHLGLTPVHQGEKIQLETGAVAWLESPPGPGPFPGAVFFHGNHRDGSMQPAAVIARRSLLNAGYIVLSVDHPAFGQSPAPSIEDDIEAWDSLPTALAAVQTLRSMPMVGRIFVLGHSMGAEDVLRLLNTDSEMDGAILFGSAFAEDLNEFNEYWYERFHAERRLRERLPREKYLEITNHFKITRDFVESLPAEHPPIFFVRFGYEWPNIKATRDALYDAIPGQKTIWDFNNASHYFSSDKISNLVIGDTRVTRDLSLFLQGIETELSMLILE